MTIGIVKVAALAAGVDCGSVEKMMSFISQVGPVELSLWPEIFAALRPCVGEQLHVVGEAL